MKVTNHKAPGRILSKSDYNPKFNCSCHLCVLFAIQKWACHLCSHLFCLSSNTLAITGFYLVIITPTATRKIRNLYQVNQLHSDHDFKTNNQMVVVFRSSTWSIIRNRTKQWWWNSSSSFCLLSCHVLRVFYAHFRFLLLLLLFMMMMMMMAMMFFLGKRRSHVGI